MQNQPYVFIDSITDIERKTIEMFYRAFSDKNPDLLNDAVAPDWKDIPLAPGQGPGPDGFKPMLRTFIAAFPDIKITIKEMIGAPGHAGVRAEITGTHQGEWFGIAPTGKMISVAIHELHHLQDGKITHTWHLEDWFGMLNQVGAWPSK
ncbi:hypothetical protein KSF_080880 [Reticulibacter mediterranei]|uniref:Ester cyclase n=1 Tax=Reticulibacter mediterranei TaxID=2778369 RepID=A0A8J3IWC9_9CHLR|nr:ester cyclase [Reticulibacter mediterranei]GHO98040.1 hypothetical protein KSF_080880 [Reticulibacter mediterranei]